jgi:hypothetical protein
MTSNETGIHTVQCTQPDKLHSDEARRLSDEYRLHRLADRYGSIGHFFAVRLADGESDHALYPDKDTAIAHQKGDPNWYAFVQVVPHDMTQCDAEAYLTITKRYRKAGVNALGRQPISRLLTEDMRSQVSAVTRGTRPSNLLWPGNSRRGK